MKEIATALVVYVCTFLLIMGILAFLVGYVHLFSIIVALYFALVVMKRIAP